MMKAMQMWVCCAAVLLAGCVSKDSDKVFLNAVPVAAEPERVLLFPPYFLVEGFELHDHGRIQGTPLIGAEMTADLELTAVRSAFSDILYMHEWETDSTEIGRQSFRIMASKKKETVEIRGVQGSSGVSQFFLLYAP